MSYPSGAQVKLSTSDLAPGLTVHWVLFLVGSGDSTPIQSGVAAEIDRGDGISEYWAETAEIDVAGKYVWWLYDSAGTKAAGVKDGFTVGVESDALNYNRLKASVPGDGLVDPAPRPTAGQCRLWTYAYSKLGEELAGIPHTLTQKSVTGDDYSSSFEAQTALSGADLEDDSPAPSDGYVYFLVRNVGSREYRLKREGGGDVTFVVPDGETSYQMPAVLGEDAD